MFVALSEDEHALLVTAAQRYVELREALAAVMCAAGQARRIGANLNQFVAALHAGAPPAQLQRCAEAAARTVHKLDDLGLRRSLP